MRNVVRVSVTLMLACQIARADEQSPRPFWIGLNGGLGIHPAVDNLGGDPIETLGFDGEFGVDAGISRVIGNQALMLQTDLLPVGGVYKLRGSYVIGHATTFKYTVPCNAPAGYSCSQVYNYRDVRSVVGLKLGAELGTTPYGTLGVLEVGFALHSQLSTSTPAMW